MKKIHVILVLLLAIAFQSFAQDTITGVVSRVIAPYFEQNVCDSRFALVSEGETFYVMVDDYWPNPYLEDLVIHYDTIPVGDEIEVVGTIMEMEDGNGESFKTINISKNLNSNHQQILGFYYYCEIAYPGPDTITAAYFYDRSGFNGYCLTINEELQPANPFVINGRTLVQGKRYLFIGNINSWIDYNGNPFNVLELADALPYDKEDLSVNGILTKENDLCLSSPSGETHYLSLFDGEEHRYLTNKRMPKTNYINDAVFMEGDSVTVGGFDFICHDIFGTPFTAFEFIRVQSHVEHLLMGGICSAPIPYIGAGPPVPGLDMAFFSDNINYYLRNPNNGDGIYGYYVVGNDTLHATAQQMKATLVAGVFIHNYLYPCYTAYINNVEFEEHEETLTCMLTTCENPFRNNNTLAIIVDSNDIFYLKPYIYSNNVPDNITINGKTINVGDSFIATGIVSYWYANAIDVEKVIDITAVESVGSEESYSADLNVISNFSIGIIEITSDNPIKNVSVCDYTGRVLFTKSCYSEQVSLHLQNHKGLCIIQIVFENGQTTSRKVVL